MLSVVLGANNFSACLGASLGAGIVKLRNAAAIASIGIFLGALLEGYKLSNVFDGQLLSGLSVQGLLAVLLSTLFIMAIITALHIPLSLSQVVIGAAWGFALEVGAQIGYTYSLDVIASWLLSPAVAFMISALIESTVLRLGRKIKDIITLNRAYAILTLAAGFYAAYTLGANTVGLVVGLFSSGLGDRLSLSLLFSAGAVVGVFLLSRGTTRSVADNLVGLNPSTALSAQFGGALSVHLFTQLGLPVSISQVVVGGMTGAASVKQIAVVNRRIMRDIIAGWTVGPIAGAVFTFLLMKLL
jgi:PiT family inorganic phosphate transporter